MKKNENGGEKILHVHCLHPIDNFAISDWRNFFTTKNLLIAFANYFERAKNKSIKAISFDH